jgi:hypothetical protein
MRSKIAAAAAVLLLLGLFALGFRQRATSAHGATSQNGWSVVEQPATES